MDTLFSIHPSFPDGFSYQEGFLSRGEEQELLQAISGIKLHNFISRDMRQNER
jgi:hypothetical protein